MTPDFFYNTEHASQYLVDSVIKISKTPSLILDVLIQKGIMLLCYIPSFNTDKCKEKTISISDEDVDFLPIQLGYVNKTRFYNYRTIRVFRKPMRGWKIGLHENNLISLDNEDLQDLLFSKNMFDLMSNNFPSIEEAIDIMYRKENNSIAFNRKFALKNNKIHYSLYEEPIGIIKDSVTFSLNDEYSYLSEELEEAING